jgi:hypothetical protein
MKVLQAGEQSSPQDGGWGGCKASATARLVCSGWKCRHDALVMRLLLRQDATDEGAGVLVRRGGGSLDLKCYCFNALTGEGMRAVSSLTALTSLELRGCSKVTDVGLKATTRPHHKPQELSRRRALHTTPRGGGLGYMSLMATHSGPVYARSQRPPSKGGGERRLTPRSSAR